MKLTNAAIQSIASALIALDGIPQPDGTRKTYKLDWRAVYANGRTLAAFKPALEAYERARLAIIAEFSGGCGTIGSSDPKFAAAQKQIADLADLAVDVDPHRFKLSQLKLEENEKAGTPIPGAVLSALLPIVDDDITA